MTPAPLHPLARLTGEEITAARRIVAESGRTRIPVADLRFPNRGECQRSAVRKLFLTKKGALGRHTSRKGTLFVTELCRPLCQ